jgi:hypothetical protein
MRKGVSRVNLIVLKWIALAAQLEVTAIHACQRGANSKVLVARVHAKTDALSRWRFDENSSRTPLRSIEHIKALLNRTVLKSDEWYKIKKPGPTASIMALSSSIKK